MNRSHYLIIGGGMSAAAAVQGIRRVDRDGAVRLLCGEDVPPYDRPPLTKALWKDGKEDAIWRDISGQGVELVTGRHAVELDRERRVAVDDRGDKYGYEKLLLATGGTPRLLPFDEERILYFRTLADYRWLRNLTDGRHHFAIVGGGFIGSEIAAALAMHGQRVTMIFPEAGVCGRIFPEALARFMTTYFQSEGIAVIGGQKVSALKEHESGCTLRLESAHTFDVDHVVAGIGIAPNTELAEAAGLAVDDGILVDAELRTSDAAIYAAGDVARFHNPILNRSLRVEHEDNANRMGETAGRNMAGEALPYDHLPYFYSDLFDMGYEAIGETDPRLGTVSHWEEPYRKGAIFYCHDQRVRGVMTWNIFGWMDAARELIASGAPCAPSALAAWYTAQSSGRD